jgi:hypothetical protein
MKSSHRLAFLAVPLALAVFAGAAAADFSAPRISPNATITQTLGITDLKVTYSRPGVRGRAIWGDVVPYGKPWRTGANDATTFTCSTEIRVNGQTLPAGTYSFFTIPGPSEWTMVFNKQKDLWGAFSYDSTQDQLRVKAAPQRSEPHEWMDFAFEDLAPDALPKSPGAGKLVLRWEKLAVPITIETDMNNLVLASARAEMAKLKSDDWRTPYRAAQYCLDNEVNADEGWQWAQKSVTIQENYQNLTLVARWHAKAGRTKEAVAAGQKAVKVGKASKDKVDTSATEKLVAEWTAKK